MSVTQCIMLCSLKSQSVAQDQVYQAVCVFVMLYLVSILFSGGVAYVYTVFSYGDQYKSKLSYEQRQCVEAFERGDHDTVLTLLPLIQQHSHIICRPSYYNSTIYLFHCAAGNGWADITKQLATIYKCDVTQKDSRGRTALHHAAMEGHVNMVEYLVSEHGCSISDRDNHGRTPLHVAAMRGHVNMVQYLVSEHGCSISDRDDSGYTPLHYVAWEGHLNVVQYLVSEHGCSISDRDVGGSTPLHLAAREGHLNVVEYLVSVGDNVMTTDYYGFTPLHHACQYNMDSHPFIMLANIMLIIIIFLLSSIFSLFLLF